MTENASSRQRGYGLFALAAAIYTAGVVAFSIWSYHMQRTNLLAQVDQSLVHATHAAEQILGAIFIECAVETETPFEVGLAANRKNLNRFADDCRFDLLGAVGCRENRVWKIISSGRSAGPIPPDSAYSDRLLESQLAPLISSLEHAGREAIRMQTLELEACGEFRVAVRYHPVIDGMGYALVVARGTEHVNRLLSALAIRAVGIGLFLYAMAFPLIVLYNLARARAQRETADLHERLQQDFRQLKEREAELEDAIQDLERFNTVAMGREGRIIELKAEVNTLLEKMDQQKRYNIDNTE
jgi:hypothetical protein